MPRSPTIKTHGAYITYYTQTAGLPRSPLCFLVCNYIYSLLFRAEQLSPTSFLHCAVMARGAIEVVHDPSSKRI